MRRIICGIVALALLMACAGFCVAENAAEGVAESVAESAEDQFHNYILIIDNSRSTTGRHSLGSATDPNGLRFDAAKLVYENVLSTAETGSQGKIGVIVFCGSENCVTYGPMDIDADPEALDAAIGDNLNEAANRNRRDNYTDIRTAVDTARSMMLDFPEGATSVILLTDGVNDLLNRADPLNQPENIEANDQTVAIIQDMRDRGADFYVIALTASGSNRDTEAFMAFINRMAEAGGGEPAEGGNCDNVLMATQSDLNSKLLQTLILAESAPDADIQNIVEHTPFQEAFTVPYEGISDATVNITFMPEDKRRLEAIQLTDPDGVSCTLYDANGAQQLSGFSVAEDRSYIILGIAFPKPGEWRVSITGKKGAEVPIDAVVRLNHNLRMRLGRRSNPHAGEPVTLEMWFKRYNGEGHEDLTASDIYGMTAATLTMTPPEGGETQTVDMRLEGNRYVAEITPDVPGTWTLDVEARNDYWSDRMEGLSLEVLPALTPEPAVETGTAEGGASGGGAPGSSSAGDSESGGASSGSVGAGTGDLPGVGLGDLPGGTSGDLQASVAEDGSVVVEDESGDASFKWKVEPSEDGESVKVSWEGGPEGATAQLLDEESGAVLIPSLQSGDSIDLSELGMEVSYTLMLTPTTDDGTDVAAEARAIVKDLELQLVPDVDDVAGVALQVAGLVMQAKPNLATSQEALDELKATMKDVQALVDEVTNGVKAASDAPEGETMPEVPVGDGTAAKSAATANITATPKVTATPRPTATTKPAANNEPASDAGKTESTASGGDVAPQPAFSLASSQDLIAMAKENWKILAIGAGALVLLIVIILVLKDRFAERVTGTLRIECESIMLSMLLRFEGKGRIKVNAPLTKHPDVARMKGSKAYDVLSNIRVSMVRADQRGRVPDSEAEHRPNDHLIRLTFTDPNTGEQQVCDVGKYDIAPSKLTVTDIGRKYELTLDGSLSFNELLSGKK